MSYWLRLRALAIFALTGCRALAQQTAEDARIAVEELAYPSKRMAALQAFVLRAEPDFAQTMEWRDPAKFAASHLRFEVHELPAGSAGDVRFLVSFDGRFPSSLDAWPEESEARVFAPKPGEPLEPFHEINYYRFTADGRAVGGPDAEMLFDGNIGDFNRDGQLEIVEYEGGNGFAGTSTVSIGGMEVCYATIKRAVPDAQPIFAVVYDMHGEGREEVEPWGGQLADADGDGVFAFQIGPRTAGRIVPKVTFNWDGARGTWIGPAPEKGAHFKVLDPAKLDDEIQSIVSGGGLGYAAELKPKVVREAGRADSPYEIAKNLPADEVSKPYRYASLAALSDEQILDYMTRRRTVWDVAHERMEAAGHVEKLWELDPKSAALEYAHAHRPPSARTEFRYGVDDLDGQRAPEQGTVMVSDGPSGCFAPSGAFMHLLHCAPGDSYLLFSGGVTVWNQGNPLAQRAVFDFRKVPLSDAEARQALQIVWWLSRIRAQRLTERDGAGGMSSTSDGFAHVEMNTPQGGIRVEGTRFSARGVWVGVGDTCDNYDQTAFLNLVIWFFNHDLTEHLGARWPKFSLWERSGAQPGADPYPPGEREHIEALSADWLRMIADAALPRSFARVPLWAVSEFGLKPSRADVARIAALLPSPSETEKRLDALDAEMTAWKKAHGSNGTDDSDVFGRAHPEGSADAALGIPGLVPPPNADASPATPAPKKRKPDPRFAKFDALFAERDAVSLKQERSDSEIASLRKQIADTLRMLDSWDDAKALERWTMEDEAGFGSAGGRLAQLDRKRALGVLRHYAVGSRAEYYKSWLANEPGAQPASASEQLAKKAVLASADIGKLLKILRDAKSSIGERQRALGALVPPDAPGKYPSPEIDRVLLGNDVLKGYGFNLIGELSRALALRVGAKAWNRLVELSALADENNLPTMLNVVPALTILAQREPAKFQEPLARVLTPQFTETNGSLNTVFWSAWQADLRVLKSELERVATSGPDAAEGERATSYSSEKKKVEHRFHLARQIASIWNEEDAATRAKLLVAFGTAHPADVMEDGAEPMRGHLQAVANLLDTSQRTAVRTFLEKCAAAPASQWPGRASAFSADASDPARAFLELVRTAMNLP